MIPVIHDTCSYSSDRKNDADTFGDDKEAAGRPNEQNYAQSYCAG